MYRFKFTTNRVNFVYMDLAEPLTFDSAYSDALSIRGANGVRLHLLPDAVFINSMSHEISTAGIGISSSAQKDIAPYIVRKSAVEHSYSDPTL